ncbi:hypothetical protein ACOMHN_067545 [Nucella lapillus]
MGTPTDRNGNTNKRVIFIEALAHAREWATTASLLYTIDTILRDGRYRSLLEDFTLVVIPVVNPDGYVHTWRNNRMWRKNRRSFSHNSCTGVDLNRNYDMKFGEVGVSPYCSDDTYPGEKGFSEPETQNVRDLFLQLKPRVVAFLSVHSYSQVLLLPWAYSTPRDDSPDNIEDLVELGQKMQAAMKRVDGKTYRLGTPHKLLGYAASGGSFDWALHQKPGIYAYCYELRPDSHWNGGFRLPASQIVPTGEELLHSLLELRTHVLSRPL